mgnify:CR=1 FL=1
MFKIKHYKLNTSKEQAKYSEIIKLKQLQKQHSNVILVAGNLSFQEAADLGKMSDIKCVIPHHYHLFEFNTEDPENFKIACEKIGTPYKILELGEGFEIIKTS